MVSISSPRPNAGTLALIEPLAAEWDAFVERHPQGSLLQRSAWGSLKARFGWHVQRLAILDTQGEIVAGAQLLFRKQYGLSVAYSPRGPLFSQEQAHNQLLLAGMTRVARKQRAIFLRIEPNLSEHHPQADHLHTWLLLNDCRAVEPMQPRSSIHVPLDRPSEALFASFSKGHRADIRRAERNGVTVRVGAQADLASFYAIMQTTGARGSFGIHSEAYYQAAWELFQPNSQLLLAELNGQTVAAHLVFAEQHSGLYLYSGADEAGLKSGANHLLEWHALQWAAAQGSAQYDFWGIPDTLGQAAFATDEAARTALEAAAKNDPLIGVYRFKKGFGGHVVRYLPAYDRILIPPLYGLAQRRIG